MVYMFRPSGSWILLVLPHIINGRLVLEQMDLVFIHPGGALQDFDGTLHAHERLLGPNCDSPDIMPQVVLGDMRFHELTISQGTILGRVPGTYCV